jgi:hypothetical protein
MAKYVGMSVTPEAREAFRQLVYAITPRVGRRVEVSEVLAAVASLGHDHMDALVAKMSEGADEV